MHPILARESQADFAKAVRQTMAMKGWTRKHLANQAKCGDGVVGKVLAGKSVHNNTLFRIAQVLGIDLSSLQGAAGPPAVSSMSPAELGGYTRAVVADYEGTFMTCRPSLDGTSTIRCYLTTLKWNDDEVCLSFKEKNREDSMHSHEGKIYMPAGGGFVYLVSGANGWIRTVTLSYLSVRHEMRGLLTTLFNFSGSFNAPVAVPIVYRKLGNSEQAKTGVFPVGDKRVADLVTAIRDTSKSYVRLVNI